MGETTAYDLVAIGGGTAGLVTAAGAAALGARTALVERDRLGGECLWTGCVPSKALIGSARLAQAFRRAGAFGLEPAEPGIGEGRGVLESVRAVRARIQPHDDPERFRAMGVDVVEGEARFLSPREIEVDGRRIRARKFVIATGSRPAVPPIEGLETTGFFTHETAFEGERLPRSVLVVGGGPIGIELAQAYRRLGATVTVVEMEDRILPREDPELSERLRRILEREGVRVRTGARVRRTERGADGEARVFTEPRSAGGDGGSEPEGADDPERCEAILVAAGRRPNVEALGLDAAGVETGPEGVRVDGHLRTRRRHILAAGDVIGGLRFTHVADHEARAAVRNALFPFPPARARVDYRAVPWCTYTDPALARVGPTEAEARERLGDGVEAFAFDLEELDRAIAERAAEGFVKLVTDRRGRVLAGHVLAPDAGTLIAEVALAVKQRLRVRELSDLVHPYPTMSEAVRKAADAYYRSRLTEGTRRWLGRYFRLARRIGL